MPYKTPWLKDKNAGIVKIRNAVGDTTTQTGNPVSVDNEFGLGEVDSLSVALNPVQNLNGYDSPWVGGAGKNKFNPPSTGTNAGVTYTLNSDGTVTANGTASGYSYKENYVTLPAGNYVLTGGGNGVNVQIRNRASDAAIAISNTAGASVQFTLSASTEVKCRLQVNQGTTLSNLKVYPMIRLATETDATYAPYENICPITGHTSASVTRTGKNMLPSISATKTMQGITFTAKPDGSVTVDGTNTGNGSAYIVLGGPGSLPRNSLLNKAITISGGKNGVYVNNWNCNGQGESKSSSNGGETTYTFTNADADYNFAVAVSPGVTVNNVTVYPMVRPAGTSAEFEPYQSNTYTINLNGTRYGGTLDVLTGVLTVTHASITLNSANMNNSETYPGWSNAGIRAIIGTGLDRQIDVQLNIGQRIGVNTMSNYDIVYLPVYVYGMNQTQWKALAMDIQIVAPLATPQTVQLTPQQISLLTGINYISSSDEVTLTVTLPGWTSLIDPSKIKHDIYDLDAGNTTGRNLAGEMLRDRVAVKEKLNMEFPPMVADDYYAMLNLIKDQFFDVQYYSPFTGGKRVATMYVGDREGEPYYDYDTNDLGNNMWTNVKFNFIER